MNNGIAITARKDVDRGHLAGLLEKYENSSSYEILERDSSNGFTVREMQSAYVVRIVKGIALSVFSFGLAYIYNEDVRDLFKERKVKQFSVAAENDAASPPQINAAQEFFSSTPPADIPTQLEVPTTELEETEEPLEETEEPMIQPTQTGEIAEPEAVVQPEDAALQQDEVQQDEAAVQPEEAVVELAEAAQQPEEAVVEQADADQQPEEAVVEQVEAEADLQPAEAEQPLPPRRMAPPLPSSANAHKEEEAPPPNRMAPPLPSALQKEAPALPPRGGRPPVTDGDAKSQREEQPPFSDSQVVEATVIAPSAAETRILNLCNELKEKSATNLADQKFTLHALRRERKESIDEIISKLERLVETSETLSNAFMRAKTADDIMDIYLSDEFALYSSATNEFIRYYYLAEEKCKEDDTYNRSHRDEIQSTYQLMVKYREFARNFRSLHVPKAEEACARIEMSAQAMNTALTEA